MYSLSHTTDDSPTHNITRLNSTNCLRILPFSTLAQLLYFWSFFRPDYIFLVVPTHFCVGGRPGKYNLIHTWLYIEMNGEPHILRQNDSTLTGHKITSQLLFPHFSELSEPSALLPVIAFFDPSILPSYYTDLVRNCYHIRITFMLFWQSLIFRTLCRKRQNSLFSNSPNGSEFIDQSVCE